MKTANTITNRSSEVNDNKVLFQVYGMDENGANFIYETCEYDNYQEALDCFNAIELQEEGEQKFLLMIVVDEDDTVLVSNYLLEVSI